MRGTSSGQRTVCTRSVRISSFLLLFPISISILCFDLFCSLSGPPHLDYYYQILLIIFMHYRMGTLILKRHTLPYLPPSFFFQTSSSSLSLSLLSSFHNHPTPLHSTLTSYPSLLAFLLLSLSLFILSLFEQILSFLLIEDFFILCPQGMSNFNFNFNFEHDSVI